MTRKNKDKSFTLMELLVAISIFMFIILTLTNVDKFSRTNALRADQKLRLDNQAYIVLEHLNKYFSAAIGNERLNDVLDSVVWIGQVGPAPFYDGVTAYSDFNDNGIREAPSDALDFWLGYRFDRVQHTIIFCPHCNAGGATCTGCIPNWGGAGGAPTIARNISDFTIEKPIDGDGFLSSNVITASVTACLDPDETTDSCGAPDNPSVTMTTSITMPSVSTN